MNEQASGSIAPNFMELDCDADLFDKLRTLTEMKNTIKMMKADMDSIKERAAVLEEECFTEMDNKGVQKINVGNHTLYLRVDMYASLEDKPAGLKWLSENDYGHLISPTVNARTLSSEMKSLIADGGEIPESIKITTKNRIGIRS